MERGPAEQVPPELSRRQRRRELDARRSRCRIRLGGHLERWCRLKDQLGFTLHSQLAQFLLDRFSSPAGPPALSPGSLQRLVALSHGHGRSCRFVPAVQPPLGPLESLGSLEWACVAGHSFSWRLGDVTNDVANDVTTCRRPEDTRGRSAAQSAAGDETRGGGDTNDDDTNDDDDTGPREPPRPDGDGSAEGAEPREDGDVNDDVGDDVNDDVGDDVNDDVAYADDPRDENYQPSMGSDSQPKRRQNQPRTRKKLVKEEPPAEPGLSEPGLSEPSPEEKLGRLSCRQRARVGDEDAAQIGPKRIRKAAKREILLCDFDGCGKIFSNRQYLNHHQKYQHVHQKTFACSEPGCGKSFNFKKHLKEHEKLHSDQRDYICEFCARPFRTSSNLLIHRRIHTGEKPLQCEICGFTCRQKASLNWHMRKHGAAASYAFPCDICGKKFEKRDNVTAHKSKSHPGGTPRAEGGTAGQTDGAAA
ncbi:zinc finger protein 692-like isoform X2 [Caloenas nicobarica]|uniref:zinc finger protein 692-like isoform X2 n=1 Tax=Caloenas nicobarica TaxID=187106 RepID=UPI0032B7D4A3